MRGTWLVGILGAVIAACGPSAAQSTATADVAEQQTKTAAPTKTPTRTATPSPTETPTHTSTPTTIPSDTPTMTPTVPEGWRAYTSSGLSVLLPDDWARLTEYENPANPFVPNPLLVASSPTEDLQITFYCMTRDRFSESYQLSPSTPQEAGAAIWDQMYSYFLYFGLQNRLKAEMAVDISVAGLPAAMALFTSPGVGSNLGVENPIELQPALDTYYKELITFLPEKHACYIVVTANTNTARASYELAAIIDSVTFVP